MITILTKDLIGKKVSCKIHNMEIDDAIITYEHGMFHLCQNYYSGHDIEDKLGYKYSWGMQDADYPERNNVSNIQLISDLYEIY